MWQTAEEARRVKYINILIINKSSYRDSAVFILFQSYFKCVECIDNIFTNIIANKIMTIALTTALRLHPPLPCVLLCRPIWFIFWFIFCFPDDGFQFLFRSCRDNELRYLLTFVQTTLTSLTYGEK